MIILCDIDGVIADPRSQIEQYLLGESPNWEEYFRHTLEMPPINVTVSLLKSLGNQSYRIVFITGRPESNRSATWDWIVKYFSGTSVPHALVMRSNSDPRPTPELKLESCMQYQPDLVLEDDPEAVKLLTQHGFTILQVHGFRLTGVQDMVPPIVDVTKVVMIK